ncbi:MAG: NAD(P)/FAD-dependent oxidoreductase [Gemmatimonadaceae bacterium]
MYDAIVVGARCAGAPTAMLLARRGHRVLLVDRATFPSDIPHGHYIHRGGPHCLARWGLLERLHANRCPPVTSFTMDLGDFPLVGTSLEVDGIAMGYGPRRIILDHLLTEAAVAAGAELRVGFTVNGFEATDGRVTGIRGRDRRSGNTVTERAAIVVGADGRNSRLAAFVKAPAQHVVAPLTCWYFSYWSGASVPGLEVYLRGRSVIFAFPTDDSLTAVFIGWQKSELPRVRGAIEPSFLDVLGMAPSLYERIAAGRRVERYFGATDVPNFLRRPFGSGWALVGDAGCHKDPYLALGICDAFRDAERLADAIDAGLRGSHAMHNALAAYAGDRDAATIADYDENRALAALGPVPDHVLRMRRELRGDVEGTRQFFLGRMGPAGRA